MNVTFFLWPVHAWFFLWERVVPSMYRVVATGLGALATAIVVVTVGVHPLLAAPLSLFGWIGLAIAQEHDERVLLPPCQGFVDALGVAVAEPPLGLVVYSAHGPRRARPGPWDTLAVLSAGGAEGHPLRTVHIEVQRNAARGSMRLHASDDAPSMFVPIDERLRELGRSGLADRIEQAESAESDADAIATALTLAYL